MPLDLHSSPWAPGRGARTAVGAGGDQAVGTGTAFPGGGWHQGAAWPCRLWAQRI